MEEILVHIPKACFHAGQNAIAIRSKLSARGIACTEEQGMEHKVAIVIWGEDAAAGEVLEQVQHLHTSNFRVIVINANFHSTDSMKWTLMQSGARDVIDWKDDDCLPDMIHARIKRWKQIEEVLQSNLVQEKMIGDSEVWKNFLRKIIEVSYFTNANILLTGESGTGKELTAQLVHQLDKRKEKSELVLLDCTTIVPELLGSEFYGHEKGAFTSGIYSREGAFALADNGSLFLDELGELPLNLQAGLLRVIQEKTYKKVGSNNWQKTNFRLICATNRDIRSGIEQGHFRKDLYFRVASSTFTVPSLNDRREDIPELIRYFLREELKTIVAPAIDPTAMNYLVMRDYPGNIRELKQLVNRIAVRYTGENLITLGDIPEEEIPNGNVSRDTSALTLRQTIRLAIASGKDLAEIKRDFANLALETALEDCGSLKITAKKLNVDVRTLQYMRKKNGNGSIP